MFPINILCIFLLLGIKCAFSSEPIPVVMWHGLTGTSHDGTMLHFMSEVEREIPGVYVISLRIGKTPEEEVLNGYFLNANTQIRMACEIVKNNTKLKNGYHGVGISQGGHFMRALAQRCPNPPMKNCISIGGPQQGVFGVPRCLASKWTCKIVRTLIDMGVYTKFVQRISVQAEYWHDPLMEEEYRRKSIFLADINNERVLNPYYKRNFLKLEKVVLVKFLKDDIVVPPESAWFGFFAPGQATEVQKFNETRLYKEDRIGLKQMHEEGKLHLLSVNEGHVAISDKFFVNEIIRKFLK